MDGEKRRGEVCVCARHTWLDWYIDQCAEKKEPGGLHTPRVNDLKRNNERARWRGHRGRVRGGRVYACTIES